MAVGVLLLFVAMHSIGCLGAPSAYDRQTESGFYKGTLAISVGLSQDAVLALLGRPDAIYARNDNENLNARLRTDETWSYWRPGFATIHFVVAFELGKVKETRFWDTLSYWNNGTLSTVDLYWKGITYNVHMEEGFREGSLQVEEYLSPEAVVGLLGPPERIVKGDESDLNRALDAAETWVYTRPGHATIQLVIAFKQGYVTNTCIRDTTLSEVFRDVDEYWTAELKHYRARTPPPTQQSEALGKLDEFVRLGKAADEANNPELMDQMEHLSWALALAGGYDFRGDFDLWDAWRLWLEKRAATVMKKCLESHNSIAVTLGIDIAMESGRKEDIDYVLDRYEEAVKSGDSQASTYRYTIGGWLKYHRPISDVGDDGGFERTVKLSDKFYWRIIEVLRPHEKTLQQIRERLQTQQKP
jgi:hypothetical protein